MGEIFRTMFEKVGAAVLLPKLSREIPVFLLGSSKRTKVIKFGSSIGKAPIKDVITFFSEYLPFSTFFEVPVLPPYSSPLTLAFLPVPFFTISFNKLLIFF